MGLPTKGTLSDLDFIALLEQTAVDRLTGMVRLETGSLIKVVYLQQGTIAFASSNEKSDRLTEVLRRAGKLTVEQIEHAQSRLRPNVSLGKTLVELGYISPKDLLWGARMQVEAIVHQLLHWSHGTFQFLEGPVPKEIVSLNLSIPHVIFEGVLKTQDRQWVLRHIGSPDAIYTITPDFHEKNVTYKLPVEEIVSRMNGKRTLEQIADAAGKDTFEVCKTVVALERLKLVERFHEKPLQMHLVVSEPAMTEPVQQEPLNVNPFEAEHSLSLGQVVQLPTMQELKPQEEERVFDQPVFPEEDSQDQPTRTIQLLTQPIEDDEDPFDAKVVSYVTSQATDNAPPQAVRDIPVPMESLTEMRREYQQERIHVDWRKIALVISVIALLGLAAAGYYWRTAQPNVNEHSPVRPHPSVQPQEEQLAPEATNVEVEPVPKTTQPPTNPASVADADPLMLAKSGQLQKAALVWKKGLTPQKRKLTIQLEIACQEKTILDAISILQDSNQLLVVPMNYKGQPCYRVLYGTYDSVAQAENMKQNLPAKFLHQQSPPQIVPVARILQ